jgi:EAL domain-containing protein (putative c-di-GMP-specific phosphodiesterase class I)
MPLSLAASRFGPAAALGPKARFPMSFSMAFQPIVDVDRGEAFAYEALVRGPSGEGAGHVLAALTPGNQADFDARCRACAIETAERLGLQAALSINILPATVATPGADVEQTAAAAAAAGLPHERIILELTEHEQVDVPLLGRIVEAHRRHGFRTAIDDFGAGHSGLSMLAAFRPDIVKLDMSLVRGLDADRAKRIIVAAVARMCEDLEVELVAEGIETVEEYRALADLGVRLMQGYLLAKPVFEALPPPALIGLAA